MRDLVMFWCAAAVLVAVVFARVRRWDADAARRAVDLARIQDWQNHPHDTPHEMPRL